MIQAEQNLIEQVRGGDYERFLAIQLAPRATRGALYAIVALNIELARIAETVSEPLMGHIRLAWWREALEEIQAGKKPRSHPVVLALAELYTDHAEVFPLLQQMIDARAADLDTSLLADDAAWRDYCNNTAAALHFAMAIVLDAQAAKAFAPMIRAEGQAYAMLGLVRAIPYQHSHGWLRFPHAPLNALSITTLEPSAMLNTYVKQVSEAASEGLGHARYPCSLRPILALRRLATLHAKELMRVDYDPYRLRPSKLAAVWQVVKVNIM